MAAFDDENKKSILKKGLKISNVDDPTLNTAGANQARFSQQANEKFEQIEDYKQQIWDLSIKFKSFVESKVLPENRGPIASNLEREVLDNLVQLATLMNEDETQEVGIGSTALCMLLMKCMLIQRDIINKLSFKVDNLDQAPPIK